MIHKIKSAITKQFRDYDRMMRSKSLELLDWETRELEHIFSLLLYGFLSGVPSAPMHISLEILGCLEHAEDLIVEKINTAHDPLAELFSLLDIG